MWLKPEVPTRAYSHLSVSFLSKLDTRSQHNAVFRHGTVYLPGGLNTRFIYNPVFKHEAVVIYFKDTSRSQKTHEPTVNYNHMAYTMKSLQ